MRAALAIAVALLAAAAPAAASETIGRSALTAGPVLAGGSVLWADAPSGRPCVLAGGPVVLERWPRATTKDTGRTVAALAGSATSTAAAVETCTYTLEGVLTGRGGRRVLERARRPRSIGGFDLAGDRAVWAVGTPAGRMRIELRRL